MADQIGHHINRDVKDENLELTGTTPVVIEGAVHNATVTTEGDLVVIGRVDNAKLESKAENVFLEADIEEGTKGTEIRAAKNVYIKSAKDVVVKAGKTVYVEHSLIDSQVEAGERVYTETNLGAIVGGSVQAGENIVGGEIGDKAGTSTKVEVAYEDGQIQAFRIYPNVQIRIGDKQTVTSEKHGLVRLRVEDKIQFNPIPPPTKGLTIGRTDEQGREIIHLHGRLDGNTIDKLEKALDVLENMKKIPIVLDLKDITYIGSVAVRVFIERTKRLGKENFVLHNPSGAVTDVLRMTGLMDVLTIL